MQKKHLFAMLLALIIVFSLTLLILGIHVLYDRNIIVVYPEGIIAIKQRNLFYIASALMLIVVIPVFVCTFLFCWKYRAGNTKEPHEPNLVENHLAEALWWGVPGVIILIMAILTWESTQELDPYRPIKSDKKPVIIQAVALQWKWLFIYPEEHIATVNFLQFPAETPIAFEITADAPMNSLWIPSLGGQIFAMPGMRTKLHLIADTAGDYRGCSANISGKGFAGMNFIAKASSEEEYHQWIEAAKNSTPLNLSEYKKLAEPSSYNPVASYKLEKDNLFEWIIMKYMMPMPEVPK